ncbi:hypothetical protein D3261_02755 [Halococcus sp. IIIV-5B]|nr:hypothetical protein D3261_02755 [Halococcus sp. IIIV-5B]
MIGTKTLLGVSISGTAPLVTSALLAIVGLFVAYQGYRGHRRNGNRTLLFLAVGIIFLTTVPFVMQAFLGEIAGTNAKRVIINQITTIIGLCIVLYGFISNSREKEASS